MCQYAVDLRDGVPTDWHLVHLGSFARGGAGLVMTEATGVNPGARISPEDTGIYTDAQQAAWQRITRFIHSQGAIAGIQLAHAGRKASTFREWGTEKGSVPVADGGWETVAPSAIAFASLRAPIELTTSGIDDLVADFAAAARRSMEAGFDLVEIHAAHGYLLHQFLSPLSNTRTDEYGGSLENRARLLLRVVEAIRAVVGEAAPVFVRLSATDWVPPESAERGWDEGQTATVAKWAQDAGADFFDISSGGILARAPIPVGPGYQVPLATFVGSTAGVPVSAVGVITDADQAAEIVDSGRADAVMLGREMLRDPNFPMRAAQQLGVVLDYWPRQYHRAPWTVAAN